MKSSRDDNMGSVCSKVSHDTQDDDSRCALVVLPLDPAVATSVSRPTPISARRSSSSFAHQDAEPQVTAPWLALVDDDRVALHHQDANPLECASRSPSRAQFFAADFMSSFEATRCARSTSDGFFDACLDARSSLCSAVVFSESGDPLHCALASVSAAEQQDMAPSHAAVEMSRVPSLPWFAPYPIAGSSVPSHCRPREHIEVSAMLVESRGTVVVHSSTTSLSSQSSTLRRHSIFLCSSNRSNSLPYPLPSGVFRRGRRETMRLPTFTQTWGL